jgi:alpha-glucosidase (family GH31 glycosyl hydrolase)
MGNKLPFIISRSQIAGSGKFVQHWTGDNGSSWEFLRSSLAEIFNFNLFAMPMTGADICGFAKNTT